MIVHDTSNYYGEVVERWRAGPVELLRYASDEIRLRCVTTAWEGEMVVASLDISKHDVAWLPGEPPTVSPSILVPSDQRPNGVHLHGFITDGLWRPCGDDRSMPLPEES